MLKKISFTLLILMTVFVINTPVEAAPSVFDKTTTNNATQSTSETSTDKKEEDLRSEGEKKGTDLGKVDGEQAAFKDYFLGQKSSPEDRLPSRRVLINKYDLKRQGAEFRSEFLRAYRKFFLEQYEKAYSDVAIGIILEDKERIWHFGEQLGIAEGAHAAYYDLLNNFKRDWLKSYNLFINEVPLKDRYKLEKLNTDNFDIFENAFRTNFQTSYDQEYGSFFSEEFFNGTNIHTVSYFEDTTIYDSLYGKVDKAQPTTEARPTASLIFKQGTVYQDSFVRFTRNENLRGTMDAYNDTASGLYEIAIKDKTGSVRLYKPITLQFVYGGHPNIGIYKWDTKRWLYQPTKFAEGENAGIYTEIPAGQYKGGKYAVFIDETFKMPKDAYYNWAFDDILISMRRNFIMQSDQFRPNDYITRYELASILYRSLYFRRPHSTFNGVIVDREQYYLNNSVMNFVLGSGIMSLDQNYNFNPNQPVTYNEFIEIVDKADGVDYPFEFDKIVDQMYYNNLHLPEYVKGGNNYITRAEVVYTLNRVLD